MIFRHALLLAFGFGISACASHQSSVPLDPAEETTIAIYLQELNQANPTDPVIDGRDPSLKQRLSPPVELWRVHPPAPASARRPPGEGKAVLAGVIERDGAMSSVRVLTSSGNRDFDASSAEAVRQWRFRPATIDGSPVRLYLHVTTSYHFR